MLAELLALVLPATCAGCRTPGAAFCPTCVAALAPAPTQTVPSPPPPGFPATTTSGDYDGVLRAALLAHKEHGRRAARPALACALAAATELAGGGRRLALVPVPSSPAAIRARGGDPVGAMAAAAARLVGAECLPLLGQRRRLADQAGLDTAGRAANLAGAFALRPRSMPRLQALIAAGTTIVIVDDVCTTGATLAEAARVLGSGGVAEPVAAVVAATRKRHPVPYRATDRTVPS